MTFVLENIRSAWNVGAIFRTADALGASIILIGYTAKPVGLALKLVKKTAIGAE
jgi:tRNA G18 (ribose-2'-O)-methylase SpoU